MKTTYKILQPKVVIDRSYKYFNNESFREDLLQTEANGKNCHKSFKNFTSSCSVTLNKQAHPPTPENKYVRGNQSLFMNKTLSKVIMY